MPKSNKHRPRELRLDRGGQGSSIQRNSDSGVVSIEADRSVRVNIGLLPAPENTYDADTWWVERQAGHVALYFGQFSGSDQGRLRTRLKIKYPSEALVHNLWEHCSKYYEDLTPVIATFPQDPLRVPVVDISKLPTEKEHTNWANFDAMSRTASQAAIDFYHVAPPAAVKFLKSRNANDLIPTPVVRILLGLYQQFEMLQKIETIIAEVKAMMPENHLALSAQRQERES